jgi:hypothetical protein
MGRTGSAHARAHKARGVGLGIGLAATLLAAMVSPPPAQAAPVVCATVYFTINGGTPNYIVNNCYVPSPWPQQFGTGLECNTVTEGATIIKECDNESLAFPVP